MLRIYPINGKEEQKRLKAGTFPKKTAETPTMSRLIKHDPASGQIKPAFTSLKVTFTSLPLQATLKQAQGVNE